MNQGRYQDAVHRQADRWEEVKGPSDGLGGDKADRATNRVWSLVTTCAGTRWLLVTLPHGPRPGEPER